MFKKVSTIILVIITLLFISPKTEAATTGWFTPSAVASNNQWTNPQETFLNDSVYANITGGGSERLAVKGFGVNLPFQVQITSIEVQVIARRSGGNPSINNMIIGLHQDGQTNFYGNLLSGACTTEHTITGLTTSFQTFSKTIDPNCWSNSSNIIRENLIDSNFTLLITKSVNGNTDQRIDYIRIRINYNQSVEGVVITSAIASPSGQLNYLTLEGTTSTVSSTMQCQIKLFERCQRSGYAGWTSQTPVATLKLDAQNNKNYTENLGSGYFSAYDWGGSDNSWKADNVEVPYNPGYSCDYPIAYYCTEDREIVLQDDFSQNQSLIATPTGQLNSTLYTEPEPTNPLQWVVWRLKQIFWEIFGFNNEFNQQYFLLIEQKFNSKAPFAYINAVFSLDFTDPGEASGAPVIDIPLAQPVMGYDRLQWFAPPEFYGYMTPIKYGLGLILWVFFIMYIILRIRGIKL